MLAFWTSMGWVFLAELGDKTQLVALSLATRFNARVVLSGILVATLLVHVFSVLLGGCAGKFLPPQWIQFIAGLSFIAFGFWTMRGDCLDEEEGKGTCRITSPFMLVAVTFFLAELGDKTMLTTCALAGKDSRHIIPVWLGSSIGMVISDGLAILLGCLLGKKLPERAVKVGASVMFFGFGIYSTVQGAVKLQPYTWALGAVIIAVLAYLFLRKPKDAEPKYAAEELPEESVVVKH